MAGGLSCKKRMLRRRSILDLLYDIDFTNAILPRIAKHSSEHVSTVYAGRIHCLQILRWERRVNPIRLFTVNAKRQSGTRKRHLLGAGVAHVQKYVKQRGHGDDEVEGLPTR